MSVQPPGQEASILSALTDCYRHPGGSQDVVILLKTMQCNRLASNLNIMQRNSTSPNCHEQERGEAGLGAGAAEQAEVFSASVREGYLLAPEHERKFMGKKVLLPFFLPSVPILTRVISPG